VGSETPWKHRLWLWIPLIIFVILWIVTPAVFWPINHDLYYAASGKIVRSDAELIRMGRRWITYDWWRVAGIALSFISSIRALSLPVVAKSSS